MVLRKIKKTYRKSRKKGQIYDELCRTSFVSAEAQDGGTHVITESGHFRLPVPLAEFPVFRRGTPCDLLLRNFSEIVGIRVGKFEFVETALQAEQEIARLSQVRCDHLKTYYPRSYGLV